jgi:hypothetical protein
MSRIRRALRHTHRVQLVHSVMPAVITALAAAGGSLQVKKAEDPVSIVIVPLVWGLAVFAGALLLIHGGEFLYRLVSGKAPKGYPRTFDGLHMARLEQELRTNKPVRLPSMVITHHSLEVRNFADELLRLLARCGWNIRLVVYRIDPQGDVLIEMQIQGSLGLEALAKFLNRHGYKAIVTPSVDEGSTGPVTVGEMR